MLAAGAAAGVAVERLTGRAYPVRQKARLADAAGPQEAAGHAGTGARRGLELYYEVDETEATPRRPAAEAPLRPEATPPPGPTVVFVHGYALNLDCWHFQREALRGKHRMVFYDQRSHGRSGRSPSKHANIDQLGDDLDGVLDALVPTGASSSSVTRWAA